MIDPIEFGQLMEKVDANSAKLDKVASDVENLKSTMNKGWGVVFGVVAILGIFANDLITWFRGLISGHGN